MFKVTEVIARPRTGVSVDDLEINAYVSLLRTVPFLERLEVAVPIEDGTLPEPTHSAVIEAWFPDLQEAQRLPSLPSFPEIDERATRLHQQAGIERWFSQVT